MLERIAELEGAAENLPGSREASLVRSKLQEARLAELERLRTDGQPHDDDFALEAMRAIELGLERGRQGRVVT